MSGSRFYQASGFAGGYDFGFKGSGVLLRYSNGNWESFKPPYGTGDLRSIHFTSPLNGWAVGEVLDGGFFYGMILKYCPVYFRNPYEFQVLPSGSTFTIQWEAPPQAVKFKLLYSMDYGTTWKPIHKGFVTGTSYEWRVPIPIGNRYQSYIFLKGYDLNNDIIGSNLVSFTIEVVNLTTLLNVQSGNTYTVTWVTNATKQPVEKVKLSYTKNAHSTWGPVKWYPIATLPGNPGRLDWTVPAVKSKKPNFAVKLVLKDKMGNTLGSDKSWITIEPSP